MKTYPFTLEALPYAYDALEPFIDQETMTIHHTKHHQAYVTNLNQALEAYPELHNLTLEQLLENLDALPQQIQTKVRNNGGGVYNHNLFWKIMTPTSSKAPVGKLKNAIDETFGSFEKFKDAFKAAALTRFGSGWAWLVKNQNGALEIVSTPNQDSPVQLHVKGILPLDVWEHAYYLKYQNKRADYIENWFNVVNWEYAEQLFNE